MNLYANAVAAERAAKIERDNAEHAAGIESLRQQLVEAKESLKDHGEIQETLCQQLANSYKRGVMLRDALKHMRSEYERYACPACDEADEALAATSDLKGVILCHAEPVAYLDANYGFMRYGNVADSLSIGTQLYAPKREPKNSSV